MCSIPNMISGAPGRVSASITTGRDWCRILADRSLIGISKSSILETDALAGVTVLSGADVLLNGLSQDRIHRLCGHAAGSSRALAGLPRDWAAGLRPSAGLFSLDQWRQALADATAHAGGDPRPLLIITPETRLPPPPCWFGEGRKSEDQVGLPKGSRSVRARGNAAAQRAAITQNPCAPKWA